MNEAETTLFSPKSRRNGDNLKRPRCAVVAAAPISIKVFMRPHLMALAERYPLTVLCAGAESSLVDGIMPPVAYKSVAIERKISPFRDLWALLHLVWIFWRGSFSVVHSITPKAGLLSMLAAWICRVPIRMHVFTGQVWATRKGFSRLFLKTFDRLIALFATHVLADSASQRQFLIDEGVVSADRIAVLANGSICGVDPERFAADPKIRANIRDSFGIPRDAVVALFLGRLNREKGVIDLVRGFLQIAGQCADLYLLVVGPDEEGIAGHLAELSGAYADRVRLTGATAHPEHFMAAADFFCLPSYREGFGSVIIEAASAGLPSLASRIYGLTDAVVDGETGLLHPVADIAAIADGLRKLSQDTALRRQMGDSARERAVEYFATKKVVAALADYYASALTEAGLSCD